MAFVSEARLREIVEEAVEAAMEEEDERSGRVSTLTDRVTALKEKISDLEISKSRKEEEFAKREREVEHMVGLERKRAEFENESAKREAVLAVREENLAAERKRFEERMDFMSDRFAAEVKYLKEIVVKAMKAK